MKLWIDNTGFYPVKMCLENKAQSIADIKEFLQFAILIIFGETLTLNGFNIDRVREQNLAIIDQLVSLGIEKNTITLSVDSESFYSKACRMAAKRSAEALLYFTPIDKPIDRRGPVHLPQKDWKKHLRYIRLTQYDDNDPILSDVAGKALEQKAQGAIDYMIATSPSLRHEVSQVIKQHPEWSQKDYFNNLNLFLRSYVNDTLAKQALAHYCPAVVRAESIRQRQAYMLNILMSSVDDVVAEIRGMSIPLPSIMVTLLENAKGDPRGVLQEAIRLRSKMTDVRKWLESNLPINLGNTPEVRAKIAKKIKPLSDALQVELGLKEGPKFPLDIYFILELPVPRLSGRELTTWLQSRMTRQRIVVLTQISKKTAFLELDNSQIEMLCNKCLQ